MFAFPFPRGGNSLVFSAAGGDVAMSSEAPNRNSPVSLYTSIVPSLSLPVCDSSLPVCDSSLPVCGSISINKQRPTRKVRLLDKLLYRNASEKLEVDQRVLSLVCDVFFIFLGSTRSLETRFSNVLKVCSAQSV